MLGQADVVLYDRLVSPEILAHARADAELIYVGKHEGEQEQTQQQIRDLILHHASAGKHIARLKGGDPLVFGRGGEEWALAIEHRIEFELIPGVSSAIAVPGLAGIPLTFRRLSQAFAVITGHCGEGRNGEWARYAQVDTLVILMGVSNRVNIAQALMEAGRPPDDSVAFIHRGTLTEELVVEGTLADVAGGRINVKNPAVFVIGQVVGLRRRLHRNAV